MNEYVVVIRLHGHVTKFGEYFGLCEDIINCCIALSSMLTHYNSNETADAQQRHLEDQILQQYRITGLEWTTGLPGELKVQHYTSILRLTDAIT